VRVDRNYQNACHTLFMSLVLIISRNNSVLLWICNVVTDMPPNPCAQPWRWRESRAHRDTHGWRLSLSLFPLTDSRSKKNTRAITKITFRVRGNVTRATIHVRHVSTRQAILALFCFCLTIPKRKKRLLVIYCSNGQLCNNVNKLRLTGSKIIRFPIMPRASQFYQL